MTQGTTLEKNGYELMIVEAGDGFMYHSLYFCKFYNFSYV